MEAFTLDSTEIIVLATAGGLFLIQIIYYLCLYNRIHARSRAVKQGDTHFTQELPPISVIICAREESEICAATWAPCWSRTIPNLKSSSLTTATPMRARIT